MHRVSVSMLRRMQPLGGSYRLQGMSLRQFSRSGTISRQNGLNLFCLGGGIVGLTLAGAGFVGCFDEWLKIVDQDKKRTINQQLMTGGLSISAFFGVTYLRKKYPSFFHLLYTKRAIGKELRKYQPRVFRPGMPALPPIRNQRLTFLKQCVCETFGDSQEFLVVTGPHGVGKSVLAKHLAAELSSKGNDLCDLKNLGVVYWKCGVKESYNTEGILDQFGDSVGEIGVASLGKLSYSDLFGTLHTYLPRDRPILMIFDAVSKTMHELNDFQKGVRDVSEVEEDGTPRIKVLVVASDSYDFAKEEKKMGYENRRRVINILGFTFAEMTEWVDDFLKTSNIKLVSVPHEAWAAEFVDPQATMPQDDKLKKEAGADGENKEMTDTEKLATLILKHEWNMNEVARILRQCVKPDPDDEKKEKKILEFADVAGNLQFVLHVSVKWEGLQKEMRSVFLRILTEVNPEKDDDGRLFYFQKQLEDNGLDVDQIAALCKEDLTIQVREDEGNRIFIHPQLHYFARNRPDRFEL